MAPLLKVQDISACVKKNGKTYKILNNINFTIEEGEILGLAGESGCGKSITALSVSGLLPQAVKISSGDIVYNGQSLVSLPEKEMRSIRGSQISIVFQDVRQALNPLIKIGSQITETLELGGSKDKEKNKNDVLELLSTIGFNNPLKIYNAYPHQLSGGMCQRVMTVIAIIRKPKLLLGDEPSSSLDEESQQKCLSLLTEMNREHKTSLLIISHDLSIIRKICSRYLIMYAGRIVEEGPSDSLFSPLHPYTNALINSIPHKDKRGKNLENITGKVPSIEDQLIGCPFAPRCPRAKDICKESFPSNYYHNQEGIKNKKVYCYFPLNGETNE